MPNDKDRPLVLVDGSSYLYRAFHALPPLTNSHGEPTGAVYGVANMLRRLLKDYDTDEVVVVFDAKGPTFRDEMFPEYKATRPPMPDDLVAQIEPLHELVRAMGFPVLVVDGVEADDVIGTLAERARAEGRPVVISTGDKDMAQLVGEGVTLVNTMTGTTLDRDGVIEKFGVAPEQIVDYLALIGDKVDNVPGIPGVGPKTAAKWLQKYGTLENLVAHADEIGGKVGERLREHLDQLPLSKRLVTIRRDLDLDLPPEALRLREPDRERLRELFRRLEFRSWLRELEEAVAGEAVNEDEGGAAVQVDRDGYEAILDEARLEHWLERLAQAELFAFDTETTDLDYMRARVVGMSFAVAPGEAAYLPLAHDYPGAPAQLDFERVMARLRPLLEDPQRAKLGHHLKYDRNVLANHGITLRGIRHDTMLESYLYDSSARQHDLDSLCQRYLDHCNIKYEEVAGKGAKQIPFNQVALEQAVPYAAEDADLCLRLHRHLWPLLEEREGPKRVYEEIEIPLIPVLSDMERTGVLIDTALLGRISQELAERMAELEQRAHALAGEPFNLGSTKQLRHILFDKLGIPPLKKTPKGEPSTAEEVLVQLAEEYELPRVILDWRSLSKLKSTYTDKLPQMVNPDTGRVHTSYHQAVAATGRLSSSDPNLQNIPIRTREGRRIREAFVAPPGRVILAADYSQIELRIMAHLSGDEGLLRAFAEGRDIHRATAAEVFGVPEDQVTDEQRRAAKAINFGLIYGMSAFGLAKQLGVDRAIAQEYIDLYFARYPGVRRYMDETREKARRQGFVETLFGRRLYLPEIRSRNAQRRQYAERTAINAPMQGTAADIIKRAMIDLHGWIGDGHGARLAMIMQVHDELVFEIDSDFVDTARGEIEQRMSRAAELRVPLEVGIGVGANWEEAH